MNTAELIYEESKGLPETEAREVLDFVEFLKAKMQKTRILKNSNIATTDEFDQFGAVFDGQFNRDACYDRTHLC